MPGNDRPMTARSAVILTAAAAACLTVSTFFGLAAAAVFGTPVTRVHAARVFSTLTLTALAVLTGLAGLVLIAGTVYGLYDRSHRSEP